jgi:hypothetical protein
LYAPETKEARRRLVTAKGRAGTPVNGVRLLPGRSIYRIAIQSSVIEILSISAEKKSKALQRRNPANEYVAYRSDNLPSDWFTPDSAQFERSVGINSIF